MVEVKVVGKDYNYFIKKLYDLNICYNNMYIKDNILYFKTNYNSFLKLKSNKGIFDISLNKRFNLIYILHEIKNNKILYIFLTLFLFYFLLLNNLIFKIEFDTDDKLMKQLILDELKKNNIYLLKFKPSKTKLKLLKKNLVHKYSEKIEWLEIDINGNNIIVSYVIKKNKDNQNQKENRSIVARKNAIIKKIISSNGVIVKSKNEYVNKGEEIISGNIIKDDIIISQTPADGIVYGEVWYKTSVDYPLYKIEKKYNNSKKINIYFNFFTLNKRLYNNYDSNNNKIYIIKNKIIPVNLYIKKENKYYFNKIKLNKEKAKIEALNYLEKEFLKKIGEKNYILDKKVLNLVYKKSTIKIDVLYKVYEDITDYKKLDINMINQKITSD